VIDPRVRLIGRFERSADGARFAWPGSAFELRFSGDALAIELDDQADAGAANTYTVIVDGAAHKLGAHRGRRRYPLASGLGAGEHHAIVWRNTEAILGAARLVAVEADALLPVEPPARVLELVGDSITCGFGIEAPDEHSPFSPETENNWLAYGSVAARALGADARAIAWSGKGVLRNGDGSTVETMRDLWTRALPADPSSGWDDAAPPADVVVVNLGTNDFALGIPDERAFVDAYRALLRSVRARHLSAALLCAIGPMLTGAALDAWRSFVTRAAAAEHAAFLEFPAQDPANGYGADFHPSARTHALMAAQLAAALTR
jgi:lysophospholipase L1-like esterase